MQSIYVKVPEDIIQNIVQQMYDDGYVYDSKNDSQFLSDRDPLIVKMLDREYREVTVAHLQEVLDGLIEIQLAQSFREYQKQNMTLPMWMYRRFFRKNMFGVGWGLFMMAMGIAIGVLFSLDIP